MKINKIKILAIIVLIGGISLLSYPFVSNWINSFHQTKTVDSYEKAVDELEVEKIAEIKEKIKKFNEDLIDTVVLTDPFDSDALKQTSEVYEEIINITEENVMGYLTIPSINVKLPIYHGTSEDTLKKGVGHLENTSIPIGGKATHSVLSSHTALPSAKLFDDLDKLKEDEIFKIKILDDELYYKIDQIKVVLPNEISDLKIDREKDYVTLVTCTPYGINTHRLLVRGIRTEAPETEIVPTNNNTWIYLIIGVVILLIIVIIIYLKKRKNSRKVTNEKNN